MPIKGLTDAPKAFLKLGQIRKGDKVPTADGKSTKPVDLDYFRVTFHPDCKDVEALFQETYGMQPRRINIRFAFPTIPEIWDANFEAYSKGGLIAKASEDDNGLHWMFYRDHETGEVLVRNGSPVGEEGQRFFAKPIDVTAPVYSYKTSKDETVDVLLEPVGRLNVVIPEVAGLRVGYFEFRPGSTKDIRAISAELASIDAWAKSVGRSIMAIPMILTRREEDITKNMNGKLSRGTSWLVHIEIGGEWGGRALSVMERHALPDVIEGVAYDEWDADAEPEPVPAENSRSEAVVIDPVIVKEQVVATPKRPYLPADFKAAYAAAVKALPGAYEKRKEVLEATDGDRKVLASVLDGILGGQLERHEFMSWLVGKDTTKDMDAAEVKTMLHILGVKTFNEPPSAVSIEEVRACHKLILETK